MSVSLRQILKQLVAKARLGADEQTDFYILNQAEQEIKSLATPTFSGERKLKQIIKHPYPCPDEYIYENATEQKEYCSCPRSWKPGETIPVDNVNPPTCAECHKEIRMGYSRAIYIKPIPPEKKEEAKECEHEWDLFYKCNYTNPKVNIFICKNCGQGKQEPIKEPKKEIEELGSFTQFWCKGFDKPWEQPTMAKMWKKIEELISAINLINREKGIDERR